MIRAVESTQGPMLAIRYRLEVIGQVTVVKVRSCAERFDDGLGWLEFTPRPSRSCVTFRDESNELVVDLLEISLSSLPTFVENRSEGAADAVPRRSNV